MKQADYFLKLAVVAVILIIALCISSYAQQTYGQTYTYPQQQNNYSNDQSTVKQEIAKLEIKVVRGDETLPISMVPRVRKDDILKVRLLDEPISGTKIDQTAWDWTLVVAYANPLINKQKEETVSQEINFRRQGWYKEYSFKVPFDSQPVFFLSPRAHYRDQITKVINKNYGDLQKIGEKMVDISNAYSQINTFLNELQMVVNRNIYGYGNNQNGYNPYGNQYGYNPYGGTYNNGTYGYPNTQYGYNSYGNNQYGINQPGSYYQNPARLDEAVERLAKSFNLQMPSCWYANGLYNNNGYNYNSGNTYGNTYGSTYGSTYGTGSNYSSGTDYNSTYNYGNNYNYGYNNYGSTGAKEDFVARSQCVAKSVNLKDFDISVTRMWQQGGVFLANELIKKYPQFAFYINMAAAAIDFIVKAFQKSPVRIVPTMLVSGDSSAYQANQANAANTYTSAYQSSFQQGTPPPTPATSNIPLATKFSVFSSTAPSDQGFVTAYPIVVQKWQAQPDPEVVSLNTPSLNESCLHTGVNLLRNTNLTDDWSGDNFTRDYKLILTSENGFRKELPLRKNIGLNGWDLNLTAQDAAQIPKVAMSVEGQIVGMRGFSEVVSNKFKIPVATDAKWEVVPETQKGFAVGGRRRIAIINAAGDCLCIQSVTYKPSFGGQFTFERGKSLETSADGRSISFEVDASNFNPGAGTLEIKTYGGDTSNLNLKLYPALPQIKELRVARGDRQVIISGERIDQLRYVLVNGYRATIQPNIFPPDERNPLITTRLAMFDDPRIRQTGSAATIELGLEDDRQVSNPTSFAILPSRPTILADEKNEIDGVSDATLFVQENLPAKPAPRNVSKQNAVEIVGGSGITSQLIFGKAPVFPITTKLLSVSVQSSLSDYDFKSENITIEVRTEKSQSTARNDLITPNFEVLDWRTMRIKFYLNGDTYTNLGGRRIQFRIRDKERGDSDWYTIKQTFIRVPEIFSVKCTEEMEGRCEMKGDGMDYIGQVSVDGGRTWYTGENGNLQAQPTADGQSEIIIPLLLDKKLLRLKLRDFPGTDGLLAGNFTFTNTVKTNFANNRQIAPKVLTTNQRAINGNMPAPATTAPPPVNQPVSTQNGTQASSTSTPSQAAPDNSNGQLSRLPNPVSKPENPPSIIPGSIQGLDEIIDLGKKIKP